MNDQYWRCPLVSTHCVQAKAAVYNPPVAHKRHACIFNKHDLNSNCRAAEISDNLDRLYLKKKQINFLFVVNHNPK